MQQKVPLCIWSWCLKGSKVRVSKSSSENSWGRKLWRKFLYIIPSSLTKSKRHFSAVFRCAFTLACTHELGCSGTCGGRVVCDLVLDLLPKSNENRGEWRISLLLPRNRLWTWNFKGIGTMWWRNSRRLPVVHIWNNGEQKYPTQEDPLYDANLGSHCFCIKPRVVCNCRVRWIRERIINGMWTFWEKRKSPLNLKEWLVTQSGTREGTLRDDGEVAQPVPGTSDSDW